MKLWRPSSVDRCRFVSNQRKRGVCRRKDRKSWLIDRQERGSGLNSEGKKNGKRKKDEEKKQGA